MAMSVVNSTDIAIYEENDLWISHENKERKEHYLSLIVSVDSFYIVKSATTNKVERLDCH